MRHECEQLQSQLLDSVNTTQLPRALAGHAENCPECSAQVAALRKTWSALDAWTAPEPSPYFGSRLQARLREERANPQSRGILAWLGLRWQPALAAALALVVGVVIGLTQFTGQGNVQPQPQQPSAAVSDLQNLDKNADVYNNFDLLYGDDQQTTEQ